jgi:hypothetical protein
MSGDGKRSVGHWPQATAPIFDSTEADYLHLSINLVGYPGVQRK